MTMIDASVLLASAFFALYGLAAAIECGLVLRMLGRDQRSRAMFTPLWEVTNVFLVFGFTLLAMLFNGALSQLSHALIATLSVALFTMLARAALVLGIFYIKDEDRVSRLLAGLLAVATFLVPLSFGAAGIYLLTGQTFYHTLLGSLLMASTVFGLAGVGLATATRNQTERAMLPGAMILAVWFLLLGCAVPLAVTHSGSVLSQNPILAISLLSAAGLALMLLRAMGLKLVRTWQFSLFACLAVPILLAWANRPFLVSAKLSLVSAYGAAAYGHAIVIASLVMLPLIVLGGWLFIKLLPSKAN